MNTLTTGLVALGIALLSNAASAGVECITSVASSVTTPNYGCYRSCGGHADRVPLQTLVLEMDKKFKDMGAFFRNSRSSCTGGSPCGFTNIPPAAAVSSDGTKATLTFKTWSLPVSVTLSADICIYNASIPPTPAVESTPQILLAPPPQNHPRSRLNHPSHRKKSMRLKKLAHLPITAIASRIIGIHRRRSTVGRTT